MSGEGRWTAGGGLYPLLGLFGLALCPRSASHVPKHPYIGPKRCLTTAVVNFKSMFSCSALHESYCLSHEYTWLKKLALLEKQTSHAAKPHHHCEGDIAISWGNK